MTKELPGLVTNLLKQGKSYRDLFDQVLVPLQPKGSNPPFFCVHGGTGRAIFFNLARHLGAQQPFYAVQSVGLDGKNPPILRIEDMAAHYIKQIRTVQPSGPYVLGGFCIGGTIAWEMAQQLQAQGERVALLALLDAHPAWALASTAEASPYGLRTRLKDHFETLKQMSSWKEGAKYLGLRVKHLRFIIRRQLWEVALRFYKFTGRPLPKFMYDFDSINLHAFLEYKLQPYPGKVVLLVTDTHAKRFSTDDLGWAKTASNLDVRVIPGLHDTIMNEANVKPYAQQLKQSIGEALSKEAQVASPQI
ncbi:MAG: alpha/beta fold hydrolase [Candidatus Korobacteraceae bacterium]